MGVYLTPTPIPKIAYSESKRVEMTAYTAILVCPVTIPVMRTVLMPEE